MIDIKYKKIYEEFIEYYKNIHTNPWHEIDERQLEQLYDSLVSSMNVDDEYSFKYFMDYIIKRLSGKEDAHTKYDSVSRIPFNFRIFENEVLINYPQDLKGSKLLSINGISLDTIIRELEDVVTYGTDGKRKYELEKALFNRYILFGIPSLRNAEELIFEVEGIDGIRTTKKFDKNTLYADGELFDYDRYLYGENATYRFAGNCLIYNHSSVQMKFKKDIEQAIARLKEEDLSNTDTIIVDIRGNIGGNSALNKLLMDFIEGHRDKMLICLTDYRVFSGGRYALRDLINLGAVTIGEEISTPINCYGDSKWIDIEGHRFSISECYFHPFLEWSASSKNEFDEEATDELLLPYIFKPDVPIEERKEDYIEGSDSILNYALDYCKTKRQKQC